MTQKRLLSGIFGLTLAAVALPFVIVWLSGQVYGTFDLSHITIAIEDLYARYQAVGEIPVWTPEFQGGFPMMANGFQSFFYPPHVILRSFLPGVWVANISLLLHAWLAAIGMWLLLRSNKLPLAAAAAGSLIFAGGGYFVGHITLSHLFFPAAWLPLILWQLLLFWQTPTLKRAAILAAALAAQVFAGHVQMFFYTAVFMLITAILLIAEHFLKGWRKGNGITLNSRLSWIFLVPPLVFLLTAVHILPILELLPLSKRGEAVVSEEAFSVSYPPWQALTWVQADIFGTQDNYAGAKNEPELLLFFGVSGTLLGLIGVWTAGVRRYQLSVIAGALVVTGFLLGSGEYSVFYRWLHSLPTPLASLANPGRAMILVHLGWSVLVAYGVQVLLAEKRLARLLYVLGVTLVSLGAGWFLWQRLPEAVRAVAPGHIHWWIGSIAILLMVIAWSSRPWREALLVVVIAAEVIWGTWWINPRVLAQTLQEPARVGAALVTPGDAPRIFSHTRLELGPAPQNELSVGPRLDSVRSVKQTVIPQRNNWQGIKVGITWNGEDKQSVKVYVTIYDAGNQVVRETSIPGEALRPDELILVDFAPIPDSVDQPYTIVLASTANGAPQPYTLLYINADDDFNPTGELSACIRQECAIVAAPDSVAAADAALTLVYADTPVVPDREALLPIFGEGFGYKMVRGHMQMQLMDVHEFMYALGEQADFRADSVVDNRTLLDRLSVGWLVAFFPEHHYLNGLTGVELVNSVPVGNDYARVYRNKQAWPRIQVAAHTVLAATVQEARQKLIEGDVPVEAVVVVSDRLPVDIGQSAAQVQIVEDTPRAIASRVTSESAQLLVVRDVVFPGWNAFVDEVPAPILTVDSLFRGVVVPAGNHEISFLYQPVPYRRGAFVSGIAWLVLLGGGIYEIRRLATARS